jgi:hypothetical protein
MEAIAQKLEPQVELPYESGMYAHKSRTLLNEKALKNTKLFFYNELHARLDRQPVTETSLRQTRFHLVDFGDPSLNFHLFYVSIEADMKSDVSGI